MEFTFSDIQNTDALFDKVDAEVLRIGKNPKNYQSKNGEFRSHEQLYEDTLFGLIPEYYLVEQKNYVDNDEPYMDVISKRGIKYEIKTIGHTSRLAGILDYCRKCKLEWTNVDYPDVVKVFLGNRRDKSYVEMGNYVWNKKEKKFKKV